jgi:hypothetical protein
LLVTAYVMLKEKRHYRELGADFFDTLNQEHLKRSCVKRLNKLGFDVT